MSGSNRHSLPDNSAQRTWESVWNGLFVIAAAVGLSVYFWPQLWTGGGIIGGDTYSYYFPQKVAYQEALRAGRLPLWNSVVSLGYPQLAESQTGALFPPNFVLYRFLDVNTAYNASHLLHYIAAYVFTWLLARRFGLGATGSHLAALSFVYGWFPPRACLEWAIFGGVYFPLIIWCVESYLQSGRVRWLGIAAVALAAFLTTGHFNLAFITLLLAALLVLLRLTWARNALAVGVAASRWKAAARCSAMVVLGFALAAPQLIPTIELKAVSQREEGEFAQAYGNIPVWYLTQPLWPTLWYSPDIDPDLQLKPGSNRIEANLYFGVIPFYLALAGLLWQRRDGRPRDRRFAILALAGAAGVVLSTGLLMPALRHVPGFGYFAGPGRYGMLAALAVGFIGGRTLDRLLSIRSLKGFAGLLATAILVVTAYELSYVNSCVTYLTLLERTPASILKQSTVGKLLGNTGAPVRMLAPGPNLPTMTGINCVPEYLGIGPRQYYDKAFAIPRFNQDEETPELRGVLIRWLQNAGVTHVLAEKALNATDWPVRLVSVVQDPFLNFAWARGREPLYVYELEGSRPLAFLENRPDGAGVTIERREPESVILKSHSDSAGLLVLLDLPYPGWRVFVDGELAEAEVFEGQFRSVQVPAGEHVIEWRFVPRSFHAGLAVFALAAMALAIWLGLEKSRTRPAAAR